MRWMIFGNLTPAVAEALTRHEHAIVATEPGDRVGALQQARASQLDLLTNDAELVEAIYSPEAKPFQRSVVYLQLSGGDVEQGDAVDRLFLRYKRLTPGRLYTVTQNRVKVRQLPTR